MVKTSVRIEGADADCALKMIKHAHDAQVTGCRSLMVRRWVALYFEGEERGVRLHGAEHNFGVQNLQMTIAPLRSALAMPQAVPHSPPPASLPSNRAIAVT